MKVRSLGVIRCCAVSAIVFTSIWGSSSRYQPVEWNAQSRDGLSWTFLM